MTYNPIHKEPNMIDMKKSISDAGGLFYQYRPCRRTAATIYDIEIYDMEWYMPKRH